MSPVTACLALLSEFSKCHGFRFVGHHRQISTLLSVPTAPRKVCLCRVLPLSKLLAQANSRLQHHPLATGLATPASPLATPETLDIKTVPSQPDCPSYIYEYILK